MTTKKFFAVEVFDNTCNVMGHESGIYGKGDYSWINESLKPTSEETALVVCHQEAIEEYVNDNYKWSDSKTRHRQSSVYGDVYDMGCKDGREVSLNRQIAQTPKEGNLFPNTQ